MDPTPIHPQVNEPDDFATDTVKTAVAMPVSTEPHSSIGLLPNLSMVHIGGIEPSQLTRLR